MIVFIVLYLQMSGVNLAMGTLCYSLNMVGYSSINLLTQDVCNEWTNTYLDEVRPSPLLLLYSVYFLHDLNPTDNITFILYTNCFPIFHVVVMFFQYNLLMIRGWGSL